MAELNRALRRRDDSSSTITPHPEVIASDTARSGASMLPVSSSSEKGIADVAAITRLLVTYERVEKNRGFDEPKRAD